MINQIIKFLLFFCKERIANSTGDALSLSNPKSIVYKVLFGKIYFIRLIESPPVHSNCRCTVNPNNIKIEQVDYKDKS